MDPDFLTLTGLVSQYSPSGSESSAVNWLVTRMSSLGFSHSYVDAAGNAVGVVGAGPRQIILLGHIDTVPGEIPVRVENGILYGRGSVDAKAPLACFVDSVACVGFVEGWQFVVIGAVEEERNSEGARFVATQYRPDFAIIGEPNRWDRLALGYKGSAWADVIVRTGQFHSAHASQTASELALEKWLQVKAYAETFNQGRDKLFERLLVTLRGMHSGADGFTQWASLSIGARLPLDLSPQAWYASLAQVCQDAELTPRGYPIPAWACDKNTPLVRALLGGIRSNAGTPNFVYKTGTADLNIVAPAWGCPSVVYGPGDSALDHTPEEHLALDEYRQAVEVLAAALATLTSAQSH
ncbi:MAG TPA: [LysW]-lysine hydrolase [Anaerolineales bacterium]|jgi:LysW-gamma-L-lysine carboxypeptidase